MTVAIQGRKPQARAQRVLVWFSQMMGMTSLCVVMGLALILGMQQAELKYYPPVGDFSIRVVKATKAGYELTGTMRKYRPCAFQGLQVFAAVSGDEREIPLIRLPVMYHGIEALTDENPTTNMSDVSRPVGYHAWGPWTVYVDKGMTVDHLSFFVRHSCGAEWWDITTHLGTFAVPVHTGLPMPDHQDGPAGN